MFGLTSSSGRSLMAPVYLRPRHRSDNGPGRLALSSAAAASGPDDRRFCHRCWYPSDAGSFIWTRRAPHDSAGGSALPLFPHSHRWDESVRGLWRPPRPRPFRQDPRLSRQTNPPPGGRFNAADLPGLWRRFRLFFLVMKNNNGVSPRAGRGPSEED